MSALDFADRMALLAFAVGLLPGLGLGWVWRGFAHHRAARRAALTRAQAALNGEAV